MESEYIQHMRKYLELLRLALSALDKASSTFPKHTSGSIALTPKELYAEAASLEDKIVSLEKMLAQK